MQKNKTYTIALYGMFTALALMLSFVEYQLPLMAAYPGMKIGLANIVIVSALYMLGIKAAVIINLLRVMMAFLLFGNAMSLMYSLAGAVISLLVMILLKKTCKLAILTISVAGAISHNIGQILVALLVTGISQILWYFIVLWLTAIGSGIVIGFLGMIIVKRFNSILMK